MAHPDQAKREMDYNDAANAYACARERWESVEHKKAYYSKAAFAEEFAMYESAARRLMVARQRLSH